MVLMSLFAEKQWRCRPEKQTYGRDRVGRGRRKRVANGNLLCDSGISTRGSVTT